MADGVGTGEPSEHLLVEGARDETHLLDDRDLALVGHGDAGALLPSMLQGVEAEVGKARHVVVRRKDAEHTATVAEVIVSQDGWEGTRRPFRDRSRPHSIVRSHPW